MSIALAGPYDSVDLATLRSRGVTQVLVNVMWRSVEPQRGVIDNGYLSFIQSMIRGYRAAGLGVILDLGHYEAPAWVLSLPNARFRDQSGFTYSATPEPNLVFATEHRPLAQHFIDVVFGALGTDFDSVRVGGGHWGELTYPQVFASNGRVEARYFGFDDAAARTNPVPAWRPGQPSPNNEATRFANWYLDSLTAYQNWQISAVRKHYSKTIAVLYPSYGMRSGDLQTAAASNLSGTTSVEINGEIQRGFDHARHVNALTDRNIAVWGTWGESEATVTFLSGLARAKGLQLMVENASAVPAAQLQRIVDVARRENAATFMAVRASDFTCGCGGNATLNDLANIVS
jgi:hypothetical protein